MRQFRDVNETQRHLVLAHKMLGHAVCHSNQGVVVPIPCDVGAAESKVIAINLTIIAAWLWEKLL